MRVTQTVFPTLRETPADAETASHVLMLRAGLIRKVMSGVYAYLPLGWRALQRAIAIVREEMDRAGAVEILMPVLQPAELWRETGRFDQFGDLMCRFRDRAGRINVLGPTHEEVVTFLARAELRSYRQLPITLYQIQTKFRDEIRPRFGVIRSREFLMKDAYSFDTDVEGLNRSYRAQFDAYCRIFRRAGLDFVAVEADTGLMGGDVSHEFMVPSPHGEDVMVRCPKCGYAANREKLECPAGPPPMLRSTQELRPMREVRTPGRSSVEEVAEFLGVAPSSLIKTLIVRADGAYAAALIPGDSELNMTKLARALGAAQVEFATPEEIEKVTGGPMGFSGPVGLRTKIVADHSILMRQNCVVGANKKDAHLVDVNVHRDFRPDVVADLRLAPAGCPCPKCGAATEFVHAIEVGHVFKLGTKYSAAMNATFQDEQGAQRPFVMGCYGIGVNRILAAAIETHHDEHGIVWPRELAPYRVHLVSINQTNAEVVAAAQRIHDSLEHAGVDVLWDDRDATPGVKFADADLLGCPIRVTVGTRTVRKGTVDVRSRATGREESCASDGAVEAVRKALAEYPF